MIRGNSSFFIDLTNPKVFQIEKKFASKISSLFFFISNSQKRKESKQKKIFHFNLLSLERMKFFSNFKVKIKTTPNFLDSVEWKSPREKSPLRIIPTQRSIRENGEKLSFLSSFSFFLLNLWTANWRIERNKSFWIRTFFYELIESLLVCSTLKYLSLERLNLFLCVKKVVT